MTQCHKMRIWAVAVAVMVTMAAMLWLVPAGKAADEDFHVFTDSPRLLLTKQRLRLLQREKERDSVRWQQFDALVSEGAPMPEAAVVQALYFQVSGNAAAGKKAVEWALSDSATDLRQLALVFDWCGKAMTPSQTDRLSAKIEKAISPPREDLPGQEARALAAIAIADRLKDQGESVLKPLVETWWRGGADKKGPRGQEYPLLELLHAIRDNVTVDLRESAPVYFKELPIDHLMGHYPAPLRGADNDLMIPVYSATATRTRRRPYGRGRRGWRWWRTIRTMSRSSTCRAG